MNKRRTAPAAQAAPPPPPPATPQEQGQRPEIKVQLGEIKVSVWGNPGKFSTMYAARLSKTYQDNGVWKETPSIDGHLLLQAAEALKLAWHEIYAIKGHGVVESPLAQEEDGPETAPGGNGGIIPF